MEMSSMAGACGSTNGDSLAHGLNFGKKIYFEDSGGGSSGKEDEVLSAPTSSSVSAAKKVRSMASGGGQQAGKCQVEGCNVDLSGAKAYYSRHKVCGMHSKAPKVVVGGLQQRFCQQCSRFHQLPEFDQGKRSCRRRLADHNERRRKPPPGILASHHGLLPPSFHGAGNRFTGFVMDFAHPKLPAGTMNHTWQINQTNNHDGNWNMRPREASPANFARVHSASGGGLFASPVASMQQCGSEGSDSRCALSLLSTDPWSRNNGDGARSPQAPVNFARSSFDRNEIDQQAVDSNCVTNPRGFGLHEGSSTGSNGLAQIVGFRQVNHHGNRQFAGELELALQGNREETTSLDPSRGCQHSGSIFHWSL